MMFDRRLVEYFDWVLLLIVLSICSVGLVVLYSAVTAGAPTPQKALFFKQATWYGVGLTAMICSFLFNFKSLDRWAQPIYVACIILLVGVLLFGKSGGGARRWLSFGSISVQPSELIKVAVVLILARYYAKTTNENGLGFRELIVPAVLVLVPFILIVRQPDLGSALLVALIAASVTVFVKIKKKTFICLILSGSLGVPLVWGFLKGYQKQRILTFLDPDRDPLGAGYHIIQSKIAIGSGMASGKGFLKGTQNSLSFLPEHHTDFIFSVAAEEWGFLGSILIIFLFLMLMFRALQIAHNCRNLFGTILAAGITALIFWEVFINIGMVMGLLPVVGVPLPLVSYGGSSIVSTMICIGLLMNISMRRFITE
jgi:rod shape determining protein RodA